MGTYHIWKAECISEGAACLPSDSRSHYSNADLLPALPEPVPLQPHAKDNLCPSGLNCWLPLEFWIKPEFLSFFLEWYVFYDDSELAECIKEGLNAKEGPPPNLNILSGENWANKVVK